MKHFPHFFHSPSIPLDSMAISRFLSQSHLSRSYPPAALTAHHRRHSSKSRRPQLNEATEIDQSSLGIKRIEDAIHSIIVRRSAPDWLPFLPGYSYWVPSRASQMRNLVGKLSALRMKRNQRDSLSEDENMSLASAKGWPASSFYLEGTSPTHPIPAVELEAAKIQDSKDKEDKTTPNSEDEEG